ncbi:MAG: hypothetical protein IPP78_13905 [Holophagaceae bacterium]|nr:hypothetical protein [Holophagaceae bacterium]
MKLTKEIIAKAILDQRETLRLGHKVIGVRIHPSLMEILELNGHNNFHGISIIRDGPEETLPTPWEFDTDQGLEWAPEGYNSWIK